MGFKITGVMKVQELAASQAALDGFKVKASAAGVSLEDIASKAGIKMEASDKTLFFRARLMSYELPNGNGDMVPRKYAPTFTGSFTNKQLNVNHQPDPEHIIGRILHTYNVEVPLVLSASDEKIIGKNVLAGLEDTEATELQVEGICMIDRTTLLGDDIAKKLLSGILTMVSQEAYTSYCECSVCLHRMSGPRANICGHLEYGSLMIQAYPVEGHKYPVLAYKVHADPVGEGLAVVNVGAYSKADILDLVAKAKSGGLKMDEALGILAFQEEVFGRNVLLAAARQEIESTSTVEAALKKLNGLETLALQKHFQDLKAAPSMPTQPKADTSVPAPAKPVAQGAPEAGVAPEPGTDQPLSETATASGEALDVRKEGDEGGQKAIDDAAKAAKKDDKAKHEPADGQAVIPQTVAKVSESKTGEESQGKEVKAAKIKAGGLRQYPFEHKGKKYIADVDYELFDGHPQWTAYSFKEEGGEPVADPRMQEALHLEFGSHESSGKVESHLYDPARDAAVDKAAGLEAAVATLFRGNDLASSYWTLQHKGQLLGRFHLAALAGGNFKQTIKVDGKRVPLTEHLVSDRYAAELVSHARRFGAEKVAAILAKAESDFKTKEVKARLRAVGTDGKYKSDEDIAKEFEGIKFEEYKFYPPIKNKDSVSIPGWVAMEFPAGGESVGGGVPEGGSVTENFTLEIFNDGTKDVRSFDNWYPEPVLNKIKEYILSLPTEVKAGLRAEDDDHPCSEEGPNRGHNFRYTSASPNVRTCSECGLTEEMEEDGLQLAEGTELEKDGKYYATITNMGHETIQLTNMETGKKWRTLDLYEDIELGIITVSTKKAPSFNPVDLKAYPRRQPAPGPANPVNHTSDDIENAREHYARTKLGENATDEQIMDYIDKNKDDIDSYVMGSLKATEKETTNPTNPDAGAVAKVANGTQDVTKPAADATSANPVEENNGTAPASRESQTQDLHETGAGTLKGEKTACVVVPHESPEILQQLKDWAAGNDIVLVENEGQYATVVGLPSTGAADAQFLELATSMGLTPEVNDPTTVAASIHPGMFASTPEALTARAKAIVLKSNDKTDKDLLRALMSAGVTPRESRVMAFNRGGILLGETAMRPVVFAKVSEEARDWISHKIEKLKGEGKADDQAAAIAYSMARKKGYEVPAGRRVAAGLVKPSWSRDLRERADEGYLALEGVENNPAPGASVSEKALYESNWEAACTELPEGGEEGAAAWAKEFEVPYPGDIIHEGGFILVYSKAPGAMTKAQELEDRLESYPCLSEDDFTNREYAAWMDDIDSYSRADALRQLGFQKDPEELLGEFDDSSFLETWDALSPDVQETLQKSLDEPDADYIEALDHALIDIFGEHGSASFSVEELEERRIDDAADYLVKKLEDAAKTIDPQSAESMAQKEAEGQQRLPTIARQAGKLVSIEALAKLEGQALVDKPARKVRARFGDDDIPGCDSCEMVSINGVPCHEHGCPDAWKDEPVPCFNCGCDFVPEERGMRTCPDCMNGEDLPDDDIEVDAKLHVAQYGSDGRLILIAPEGGVPLIVADQDPAFYIAKGNSAAKAVLLAGPLTDFNEACRLRAKMDKKAPTIQAAAQPTVLTLADQKEIALIATGISQHLMATDIEQVASGYTFSAYENGSMVPMAVSMEKGVLTLSVGSKAFPVKGDLVADLQKTAVNGPKSLVAWMVGR